MDRGPGLHIYHNVGRFSKHLFLITGCSRPGLNTNRFPFIEWPSLNDCRVECCQTQLRKRCNWWTDSKYFEARRREFRVSQNINSSQDLTPNATINSLSPGKGKTAGWNCYLQELYFEYLVSWKNLIFFYFH